MDIRSRKIKHCCWLMHELEYYSDPLDWRDESVKDIDIAINQLEEEYLDKEEQEYRCKYWNTFDDFEQHIKDWKMHRKRELHLARGF